MLWAALFIYSVDIHFVVVAELLIHLTSLLDFYIMQVQLPTCNRWASIVDGLETKFFMTFSLIFEELVLISFFSTYVVCL